MKLPRPNNSPTEVFIKPLEDIIEIETKAHGVNDAILSLTEREVSDLITMLQYYKLQVWPEDKEN